MHSDINNLVMDPSTQGEKKDGHKLVFMMFLLKQLNGPTALLDFINSSITRDLPFLNVYKEEMTVSCVCVCGGGGGGMCAPYAYIVHLCSFVKLTLIAIYLPDI